MLLLSINAKLVCGLSDKVWCIILSIFLSFCPATDISVTVIPIGVKFFTMVHIGPGHKVSHLGAEPPIGPKIPNFERECTQYRIAYLENGKSQRYMSIRA